MYKAFNDNKKKLTDKFIEALWRKQRIRQLKIELVNKLKSHHEIGKVPLNTRIVNKFTIRFPISFEIKEEPDHESESVHYSEDTFKSDQEEEDSPKKKSSNQIS